MALDATLVPGLTRGLQVLRLLSSPMTIEELVRRTGVPKSSVRRIVATLCAEGLAFRDPETRTYQAAMQLVRNRGISQTHLMPGDAEWQRTPGSWIIPFARNGVPCITTYGTGGDSDMGVIWRWLPNGADFGRLRFTLHGGHAQVILLQGGGPVPVKGDFPRILNDLLGGRYGTVLAVAQGPDSNEMEITVDWDLAQHGGEDLKVVIIDALDGPWGFVSVSRMTLRRY